MRNRACAGLTSATHFVDLARPCRINARRWFDAHRVPREIKDNEFRVGLTPRSVAELTHHGHQVLVEGSAGIGSGLADEEYVAAGATIVEAPREIFARAEMIVKVKEPLAAERKLLRRGQILFTYLHLAPDLAQTRTSSPAARPASPMRP